ncbi:hypothetical protein LZ554_000860 [Drepanopeziza brunnea f. sp. 'monogermtubi']|nr:hypothetical protein LZ554_000860 [Drepanopeziza brunnea f. sp. 'monogermtubi']
MQYLCDKNNARKAQKKKARRKEAQKLKTSMEAVAISDKTKEDGPVTPSPLPKTKSNKPAKAAPVPPGKGKRPRDEAKPTESTEPVKKAKTTETAKVLSTFEMMSYDGAHCRALLGPTPKGGEPVGKIDLLRAIINQGFGNVKQCQTIGKNYQVQFDSVSAAGAWDKRELIIKGTKVTFSLIKASDRRVRIRGTGAATVENMASAVVKTYNTKEFALFRHAYQGIMLDEWVLELTKDPTVKASSLVLEEGSKGGKEWMCTLSHEGAQKALSHKRRYSMVSRGIIQNPSLNYQEGTTLS